MLACGECIPKKAGCLTPRKEASCAAEKAQIVIGLRPQFALPILLKISGLVRSSFYCHEKTLQVADKAAELKAQVAAIYARHKGRYGYRRITAAMRQHGRVINHKKVQRLMKTLGLKSLARVKKYRSYKGASGRIAPDMLKRDFVAHAPNQKLVTDVTEFKVGNEKLYLSPVMDLQNGEIIAFETRYAACVHFGQ